jgi:hypothetical protein
VSPGYRRLDPERIIETASLLRRRIEERFPHSGLGRIAAELEGTARTTMVSIAWVSRPHMGLRLSIAGVLLLLPVLAWWGVTQLELVPVEETIPDFIQTVEAGLASVVFVGAAVIYLLSLERRKKRGRVFERLHELRAMAHIVDMHQLTKDPERVLNRGESTPSSPTRTMTAFELGRYLDYCSELMSLITKVAALYAQCTVDEEVIEGVDEIDDLANGLSRKIWQKIMLLHAERPGLAALDADGAPSG